MTSRTSPLREHATDRSGIVHRVRASGFSLLTTECKMRGQWEDRDYVAAAEPMAWDSFDPKPDVTCMACLVKEARR